MIKYLLKCQNKHEFESWFSNSKQYEKLKKKNLIECIFCKSFNVEKSIMSPNIIAKNNKNNIGGNTLEIEKFIKTKKDLQKIKKFFEKNFQFVGNNFSREVRDIYYDNKKNKNIYGTISQKEKEELIDEGIEVASVPWIKDKEN